VGPASSPRPGFSQPYVEDEKFFEPFFPVPTLIICGAGHIGEAVCKLAAWCGFTVIILDDRTDYANRQRFPDARNIIVDNPASAIRRFPVDADTYIALVTRGHRHDALVLREVIHSNAAYIGMIGSRRKLRTVMEGFIKEGVATAEDFRRVHSPMGVPLGALSVQEIAVSIVAEMIAIRRGVEAPSLSVSHNVRQ
jgi:xanthine dehydrogenase accessory factor